MAMKDRITTATPKAGKAGEATFRRPTGRASYPRRMTLDLTNDQHQWLRAAAHEHRVSAAGLLRAALDNLAHEPTALADAAATANAVENPDL